MEYEGLVGDAFEADENKSNKKFGFSLSEKVQEVEFENANGATPIDPVCKTVTLMKSEKRDVRNMVAVSEDLICYIVKGNLLRVIAPKTGEKVLLRGHSSAVLDVRFSNVDKTALCSVEDGEEEGDHIFLWELTMDNGVVNQKLRYSIPLRANVVKCHPKTSKIWAIANDSQLGVFHVDLDKKVESYNDLQMKLIFRDKITDVSFSTDGLFIAAITGPAIAVFRLNNGDNDDCLRSGNCSMKPYSMINVEKGYFFSGVSFLSTADDSDCVLLTLSTPSNEQGPCSRLVLNVWDMKAGKRQLSQSVALTLPRTSSREQLTFPASTLTVDSNEENFLMLSNRWSKYAVCLGIQKTPGVGLRLYHCTFINLEFPVSSVVASSVLSGDIAEASKKLEPHIQISCYQNQNNGQCAVQQFLAPLRWLFQEPPSTLPLASAGISVEVETTKTVRNELGKKQDSSSLLKGLLCSSKNMILSPDEPLQEKAKDEEAKSGISILYSSQSGDSNVKSLGDKDLLSSLPVGSFPDFALLPGPTSTGPPLNAKCNALAKDQVDIGVKSKEILLGALKVHPPPAPPQGGVVASSRSKRSDDSKSQVNDMARFKQEIEENQKEPEEEDDDDDWERASNSINRSQSNASHATPNPPRPGSEFDEILSISCRMEKSLKKLEERCSALEAPSWQKTRAGATGDASIAQTLADVKADIAREVVHSVSAKQSEAVSTAGQQRSQEAVANILASEKWRQKLSTQISNDIRKELMPEISQKIRDTVKNDLKQSLAKSFQSNFESIIVPAYEAGSKEMFSQMQLTLMNGVSRLNDGVVDMSKENSLRNKELQNEVASLKEYILRLESKIEEISGKPINTKLADESASLNSDYAEDDHKALFRDGRIGESLEAALESKMVGRVLWIFNRQCKKKDGGLRTLLESSDNLCIVCAVQQLAADLAYHKPEEGIQTRLERLKEMVMYLIDGHMPTQDISRIVAATLNSLESALKIHTLVGARTDVKMLCSILSTCF